MPEVIVRKRVGRRKGDLGYRIRRWSYRHRPQLAVAAAFVVAGLLGILLAMVLRDAGSSGGGDAPPAAESPA